MINVQDAGVCADATAREHRERRARGQPEHRIGHGRDLVKRAVNGRARDRVNRIPFEADFPFEGEPITKAIAALECDTESRIKFSFCGAGAAKLGHGGIFNERAPKEPANIRSDSMRVIVTHVTRGSRWVSCLRLRRLGYPD